jgi:hypothetical protein
MHTYEVYSRFLICFSYSTAQDDSSEIHQLLENVSMKSSGLVFEIPKIPTTSAQSSKKDEPMEAKCSKPSEEFVDDSDSNLVMPREFQAAATSHGNTSHCVKVQKYNRAK